MAKTISDEKMKLSIIIDGNVAQKELLDLEKSTRSLKKANSDLLFEQKVIEKQLGKDSAEYKALSVQIKANTATMSANKTKMAELQDQIGLTGLTMKQLGDKAKLLRMQLLNAIPGGEAHKQYTAELAQVSGRINELRGNANTAGSSIGSLADKFNRYQGLAISVIAGLTGVALSIQKIIDINGKLSDAQSDVMKTTGQTKEEVDELTKSFGVLQTRTSRIDLLGIAEQGGRIGVAKAEIGDFVNVMNKASVALGDSFTGGAEEVANKLGKIKFLFAETKDLKVEESYNAIGSAINDLGANGVASEANIADFTTRIGSLTDVLKPTIQETLALGTAFEESGIEAEVSARAYNIFMKQASTESAKFAKVMGISQKSVEDMINTDPLEFMLNFSQGLKGMNATETAKTLDYLGINADGANKVIGAMGNNMGRFRELIDLSNNSFASGTSLINEYNIKNNNLAATLEKISKRVSGWFSSETFIKWLSAGVEWIAKFIGATDDADGSVTAWKNTLVFIAKVLAIVTAAMLTNVAWQKLVVLWTNRNTEANLLYSIGAKARAFADGVAMVASQAYAMTTMLLTGNIKGAIQAFRVMTATMMTTPWGFILGAVAAIGAAYLIFSDEAKKAETSQSMLNKTLQDVDAVVKTQSASFLTLISILKDKTASTEAQAAALKKAKEIGGEYTKGLTLENIATATGKKLIDSYIKSLEKKAMLQILEKRQASIMEEMATKKNLSLEEEISWYDKAWASVKNLNNPALAAADVVITASNKRKAALSDLQNSLNLTNAEMKAFLEANPDAIANLGGDSSDGSTYTVPPDDKKGNGTASKKDPNATQEEINRIKLESNSKFNELLLKQERQKEDDRIAIMEEGYAKDMAIENQRFQREIDDLNKQKVHTEELAKMDEEIAKAKESKDTLKYNALLAIRQGWTAKNLAIDNQVNEIIEGKQAIHNLKLATIQEKGATEILKDKKEAYDREKVLREIKFNEELAALGNNKIRKAKLTEKYNLEELAHEEQFLKELIAEFNTIVGKGKFNEVDLSLLSPEQVQEFTDEAAKVGLTLSELINKKNELLGKDSASNAEALGVAGGTADIFGFTPDNWLQFHDNLATGKMGIEEMIFAVTALTNAYSMYSQFLDANESKQVAQFEKNSNAKKARLKQQLDQGSISQDQYNKGVEKADSDLAKKKAEIELKQAKRQKAIAISNIAMSTGQAILGIWAQFPKFDFGATAAIMSGVVGAMGLAQIAMVARQPLPSAAGYEQGLYPEYVKRQQDGKTFKSTYGGKTKSGLVKDTSHFLVAENGPEMVIDNKAWRQMNPEVKDALVRELRGVKGFEQGLYNENLKRYEVPAASGSAPASSSDSQMLAMVLNVISENTAVMKDIKESGILAIVSNKDYNSMKNIKEGVDKYVALRKSNKL
jgi:tubulin-specific chaperone A